MKGTTTSGWRCCQEVVYCRVPDGTVSAPDLGSALMVTVLPDAEPAGGAALAACGTRAAIPAATASTPRVRNRIRCIAFLRSSCWIPPGPCRGGGVAGAWRPTYGP